MLNKKHAKVMKNLFLIVICDSKCELLYLHGEAFDNKNDAIVRIRELENKSIKDKYGEDRLYFLQAASYFKK